jgi:hypothetical protein
MDLADLRARIEGWIRSGSLAGLGFPQPIESIEWTEPGNLDVEEWQRLTAHVMADGKPYVFSTYARKRHDGVQVDGPSLRLTVPMP